MHNILFTSKAEKEFIRLDKKLQARIATALDELATFGYSAPNTKKLQTPFSGFRKRVGDYRILFEINGIIVIVYKIDKRSEVYR